MTAGARFGPKPRPFLDTGTGEVRDVWVPLSSGKPAGGEYVKVMQSALERIVKDDLQLGDYHIFLALLTRITWDEFMAINIAEFSEQIGRDRSSVHGALKRLESHGYVEKKSAPRRSSQYRLAPDVAFKGDNVQHTRALDKAERKSKMEARNISVVPDIENASEVSEEIPGQSKIKIP